MRAYGKTDVGKVRVSNQDTFMIYELPDSILLAVVCDGMGGANAGNVASKLAAETIPNFIERSYRSGLNRFELLNLLKNAIVSANIEIFGAACNNAELKGMGTTVVATLVSKDFTLVANVGDSRAYIIGDDITQLTRDHSVVQTLIESGKLTAEEASTHPKKNVITRALGIDENILVDAEEFTPLKDGETLLLCSDGLTNFVKAEDIKDIVGSSSKEKAAEILVARANHNGGGDNVTAVTVTV